MRTVKVLVLELSLLALSACSGGQTCPSGCPAADANATVLVTTMPAIAVEGVQATLTGPVTGTMPCQPTLAAILCGWPYGVVFTPGTYSLQVAAPGYQTTTLQVEVTISPPFCGNCTVGSIQPSSVLLSATDGGDD